LLIARIEFKRQGNAFLMLGASQESKIQHDKALESGTKIANWAKEKDLALFTQNKGKDQVMKSMQEFAKLTVAHAEKTDLLKAQSRLKELLK
jgi:hypothetical protein